jgi:hypothetical protein
MLTHPENFLLSENRKRDATEENPLLNISTLTASGEARHITIIIISIPDTIVPSRKREQYYKVAN